MDVAYSFARIFANTKYEDLPREAVDATKKEILDLLGVALGGAAEPGATHVCALMKEWGGREESSIIGSKQKVPAPNAAQANATMAHALDFDDVHEAAVMHPGIRSGRMLGLLASRGMHKVGHILDSRTIQQIPDPVTALILCATM